MPSRSKIKGNYHENWFVKLFSSWKLPCKKVPLSGSLGGEHTGDLKLTINDKDIALYKRKTGDPRWVAVIPDKIMEDLIK